MFILLPIYFYSQNCDDSSIKTKIKKYNGNISFRKKAEIAFDIATCYKSKNDSLYIYWLTQIIDNNKKDYGHPKQISQKINQLYQTGFAYYKLKDYKASETFFEKAIYGNRKSNSPILDSLVYLYYGISLYKNNKFTESIDNLNIYKLSQPTDTISDIYIKKCNLEESEKNKPKYFNKKYIE